MTDTMNTTDTVREARDIIKLKAVPMILAMELLRLDHDPQEPKLIAFNDLDESLMSALSLELDGSRMILWDEIHYLMVDWGWSEFCYDCTETFFGPPAHRRASLMTIGEKEFLLQAGSVFPHDFCDREEDLRLSDFGFPMMGDDADKTLRECSNAHTDGAFVQSFVSANTRPSQRLS